MDLGRCQVPPVSPARDSALPDVTLFQVPGRHDLPTLQCTFHTLVLHLLSGPSKACGTRNHPQPPA